MNSEGLEWVVFDWNNGQPVQRRPQEQAREDDPAAAAPPEEKTGPDYSTDYSPLVPAGGFRFRQCGLRPEVIHRARSAVP